MVRHSLPRHAKARPKTELELEYIFGLDLGLAQDHTALVVLERDGSAPALYKMRHLQRFPLQTPYQEVCDRVKEMYEDRRIEENERHLVVDATGVGKPVVEMLEERGLMPVSVSITSGFDVTRLSSGSYRVPKRALVSAVQMVIQSDRLKIAGKIAEAQTFLKEAQAFKVKVTAAGNDTYEAWREKDHDDLVLAAAVAVWYGDHILGETPEASKKPVKTNANRERLYYGEYPRRMRRDRNE